MPISDRISAQIIALLFSFHLLSRVVDVLACRMDSIKKETKLNVRLKAMRFDEAIYVKLNITVVILTELKAHKVMATYIFRKI